MIDLTPLLNAAIMVLAALAVRYLVPWLKANTTEKQRENIDYLVRVAVGAAEQVYDKSEGAEKKEYVMEFLKVHGLIDEDGTTVTMTGGYKLSLAEIEAAVEAAVLTLHKELAA